MNVDHEDLDHEDLDNELVFDPILLCSLGCEWYSIGDGVCNPQADLDNERRP